MKSIILFAHFGKNGIFILSYLSSKIYSMKPVVTAIAILFILASCDFIPGGGNKVKTNKVFRDDGSLYAVFEYKDTVMAVRADSCGAGQACSDSIKKVKKSLRHGLYKGYYRDGKLRVKVNYKNGKKEGKGSKYYPEGKEQARIYYKDGLKHGKSVWFYKSGKPYRVTYYHEGKMHGPRRKYFENGKLKSEIIYKYGAPQYDKLKEYTNQGYLVKDYPVIRFELTDHSSLNNEAVLKFYLSNRAKDVEYYQTITEDGESRTIHITAEEGVGERRFYILKNSFVMKKIKITAKTKTAYGNPYSTTAVYNLAIENR